MPATEKYLRPIGKLHAVFLASVLSLVFATIVILLIDHDDEWRDWQDRFAQIEASGLHEELQKAAIGSDGVPIAKTEAALHDELALVNSQLAGSAKYQELAASMAETERQLDLATRSLKNIRANRDVKRADYDLSIEQNLSATLRNERYDAYHSVDNEAESQEEVVGQLDLQLRGLSQSLQPFIKRRTEIEGQLKALSAGKTRIQDALDIIDPDSIARRFKRKLMTLPIIDGFNSHHKVIQDWLPDMRIALGMARPARFDRCRTCHLGIDRFGEGNRPVFPEGQFDQPFTSHPRPDLYLTASSPHPVQGFGCTSCHDGQGSATSFNNAQHGPNDPHVKAVWSTEYGYAHNHFWEYPMHSGRLLESGCIKCHHDVIELGVHQKYGASAPKAYRGWELIREYGCFGCHEINGYDGKRRIGPDIRLEPSPQEAARYAEDPALNPGTMRKVGPSLLHISQKVDPNWIAVWTKDPVAFRPSTRMPRFFGLTNTIDEHGKGLSPVEIAAISHVLQKQSTDLVLDQLQDGYVADPVRGKKLFMEKGCLACHQYDDPDFKGADQTFGPDLTAVTRKIKKGKDGFEWLYTWIRNPQKHHPRTRMPVTFLEPYQDGPITVDPAADIAAFLTQDQSWSYAAPEYSQDGLVALARLHLAGSLTDKELDVFMSTGDYPRRDSQLKGDDAVLVTDEPFNERLLTYVGKRSISRYGCYGCHEIAGYGAAKTIGTGLHDWGRKDPSRLAPEHIHEFLHHHGQADGSSTAEYVSTSLKQAAAQSFDSQEQQQAAMRTAFFYDSLISHGRPGFIFQKLRDPRSYDYRKTETKKYTERLVMPQFKLSEQDIEAISTFVLGLIADPPEAKYIYKPGDRQREINSGEVILRKYNCVACHLNDLDSIDVGVDPATFTGTQESPSFHSDALNELLEISPPVRANRDEVMRVDGVDLPVLRFRGMLQLTPDPEESDPEARNYSLTTWEPARSILNGQSSTTLPGHLVVANEMATVRVIPSTTGSFSKWRVLKAMPDGFAPKPFETTWQSGPPPLHGEGRKVHSEWLYEYVLKPHKIRHTVGLRMPEFSLSQAEASGLARYFEARDSVQYPFKADPRLAVAEFDRHAAAYQQNHPLRAKTASYDQESWSMLTTTLCIKCHAVGGVEFKSAPNDPNVTRGPDLENVSRRLKAEWLKVWVSNPKWITPYTAMPLPFPADKKDFAPLFEGDATAQTLGVRDALLRYDQIVREIHGIAIKQAAAKDVK